MDSNKIKNLAFGARDALRAEVAARIDAVLEPGSPDNGDTIAADVLATHRDGIEVLRHALAGRGSAYAGLLDALVTALPPLDEDTRERYLRLVTAGPPAELVGTLELPFPVSNQETRS